MTAHAGARALTMPEAAAEIVGEQARVLRGARRGARAGDADAVHDMRVASRRIRAALRIFEPCLVAPRGLRRRVRKLAGALGDVRDLDVMAALLSHQRPDRLGAAERRRLEDLVFALGKDRERARRRLAQRLAGDRFRALARRLERLARHPEVREGPEADAPAGRGLDEAVTRLAEAIARQPAMAEVAPDAEALHALRIAFKRLRYALEFHAGAGGLAYDTELAIARGMQDCLGELHDTDVLLARLADGGGAFAGPWPHLVRQLETARLALLRRFAVLRKRWRARTAEAPVEPAEPRFVALEPAAVQLRLITGGKQIASAMIR